MVRDLAIKAFLLVGLTIVSNGALAQQPDNYSQDVVKAKLAENKAGITSSFNSKYLMKLGRSRSNRHRQDI